MSKFFWSFLLISNLSMAQIYYSHYINETSVWRIKRNHHNSPGTGPGINTFEYVTSYNDGTMNYGGYTYFKNYEIFTSFGSLVHLSPTYIREDSNGNFYTLNLSNGVETKYFDNNSLQSVQNGTPINNLGTVDLPTSCTAIVSFITVDGLNLKKIEAKGYMIEGIGGIYRNGICTGITYTTDSHGYYYYPAGYNELYSYTKNGSTYTENSTVANFSDFPVPVYLNRPSYNTIEAKIFPNPTSNKINIQSNSKISLIEVIDIQGRKLETIILNDFETKFDFSNYQKGTYIIKLSTDLGIFNKKIIKE